jgi:hypothetical protein
MLDKALDQVTKDVLGELASAGTLERRTLEYKEQLPGDRDRDRLEFMRDATSFANAAGGDIIYGVRDARAQDLPTGTPELIGIPMLNVDQVKLRMESMLVMGADPPLRGVQYRSVEGFPQGPVLIVRVPRSWNGIHMVTAQGDHRFYSRHEAGRFPMRTSAVRNAIVLGETIAERVRRFRDERLGRIVAGETPIPLRENPRTVLHVVPLQPFDGAMYLQERTILAALTPMAAAAGYDGRFNVDGFATYAGTREPLRSYTQLFRTGSVEAVDTDPYYILAPERWQLFNPRGLEAAVTGALNTYCVLLRGLGVQSPLVVMTSIVGARNYHMQGGPSGSAVISPHAIDRDVLILPDVLIAADVSANVDEVLRPVFDALWQSVGYDRSYGEAPRRP